MNLPRFGAVALIAWILLCCTAISAEPLSESERNAFLAELKPLQDRLTALRMDARINEHLWADANIFVKGVVWALDLGPIEDAKGRELLQTGLRRARERVDALESGKISWRKRTGKFARGFVSAVDGSIQPYGVIVPKNYDRNKPTRLDVVLHGSSGDRTLGVAELKFLAAFDGGDDGASPNAPPDVNFIELHPLGRLGENAYRFEGETDVFEAIEAVCRNYNIDRSRIVLRGSSLGGVGSWAIGLKRPDRFVAVGPTAGPVDTYVFAASKRSNFIPLAPLTSWQKLMLHEVDAIDYAANAGMVPVVALMGDQDAYLPSHILMQEAFAKEGIPFVGIVDKGAGHGPTQKAYAEQYKLLGEHAARGQDPAPKHVRFVTWTLKFSKCYWLEILGLGEHYKRAEIEATLDDHGSVVIEKEPTNITRFAIKPPALQEKDATLTIAGKRIRGFWQLGTSVVERTKDGWRFQVSRDGSIQLTGKRPGLQGPIDDAFFKSFLCVRPTGPAWNPAVGAWANSNLARFESEWRRHYRAELPIKNDTDVTPEDVRDKNLILFGDPGSNRWIRDVLPALPIRWTRETLEVGDAKYPAIDHAAELIHPNPLPGAAGRYIVLNSGHTYHDYELQLSYMVFPRLGDWAVMKVGTQDAATTGPTVNETVVESGFFDEDWKNPRTP